MEVVSCTRPAIQTVGHGVEFVLTVDRKVSAFRQILSQQPVGVFASAALPGAVRVAKVHVHASCGSELFMPRYFFALVVGEALAQWRDNRIKLAEKPTSAEAVVASSIFASSTKRLTRSTRNLPGTGCQPPDEVAFPVSGQQPVLDFGRSHTNTDYVGSLSAPVCAPCTRHARAVATTQAGSSPRGCA
ncbi:hypothetical protein B0G80_9235 [Paraburkholderia sp. BL6669N2]|nr:hypothetical protein B0G80_9235 [Paraburkholderia sp. BL6669N2]